MSTLDRIDSVEVNKELFSTEFKSWLQVLMDSLNSIITTIEQAITPRVINTAVTQLCDVNTAYVSVNALQTTYTLPLIAAIGSIIMINGQGAGGWILKPGTGQTIEYAATTAATSITSAERYDSITVMAVELDSTTGYAKTWITTSAITTGFIFV